MCAEGVQKVNKSKQVAQKCNFRVFANVDVVPILSFWQKRMPILSFWQKRMPIFSFVPKRFCQKMFAKLFFAKNCQIQTWIEKHGNLIFCMFKKLKKHDFNLQD